MDLNEATIAGVVRHVLTVMGGALFMSWGIEGETLHAVAGAIATLVGFGWSVWDKRRTA